MENLRQLIKQHHDPSLLKPEESPNENKIILLWNDGEVTETKGGSAFLKRSQIQFRLPLSNIDIDMPEDKGEYSYMMVKDINTADIIRNEMLKFY